jgi:hypothetical protein|tara:strand:- start:67 stop:621 length:555 start_codon:yes stop_codon:yes gene_type:complete
MQDLLEGRDLKPDVLAATGTLQDGNARVPGAGRIVEEDEEQDEMLKLQHQVVRKNIDAVTVRSPALDLGRLPPGSLKDRGVTDKLAMAKMLPTNKYFQEFVREHQEGVEKVIEKTYGSHSYYGKTLHKANIQNMPPIKPFKQRFYSSVNQHNVFRAQNKKIFYQKSISPVREEEKNKNERTVNI